MTFHRLNERESDKKCNMRNKPMEDGLAGGREGRRRKGVNDQELQPRHELMEVNVDLLQIEKKERSKMTTKN